MPVVQRGAFLCAAVVAFLVVLVVAFLPSPAAAAEDTVRVEIGLVDRVNADRAAAGLAPLPVDVRLVASSRAWSADMAANGFRHDPGLASAVPPDAVSWSENVGHTTAGDALGTLNAAFAGSAPHQRNRLDPHATAVGVGVVSWGGRTWVTERFTSGSAVRSTSAAEGLAHTAGEAFAGGQGAHAVLVRDDAFPDALAAGALAGPHGPILASPPGPVLLPRVRHALGSSLAPGGTVYVVGGEAAVTSGVEQELQSAGYHTVRIAGDDRVGTAARVADAVAERDGRPEHLLLAPAHTWPDAASAGAYGARHGAPVLLAETDHVPAATTDALGRLQPQAVHAVGGGNALSDDVVEAVGAERFSGGRREDTAVAVARDLWGRYEGADGQRFFVAPAHGDDAWVWALGGAPLAARGDAPLLLASEPLADGVGEYLSGLAFGGDRTGHAHFLGPVDQPSRDAIEGLLR